MSRSCVGLESQVGYNHCTLVILGYEHSVDEGDFLQGTLGYHRRKSHSLGLQKRR